MEVGELSVRRQEVGGDVAGKVKVIGAVSPYGRRQVVVLIHGYANDQPTASGSFQACINNLLALPGPASTGLPSPFFKFYWPGDTRLRWFSKLSYPWEITPAVDSAARLADFVAGLSGPGGTPVDVHLIAHSLGSRLALEMLAHFVNRGLGSVLFRSVTLMAGAVPVRKVEDPRQLLRAALVPDRRQALCSTSDNVLHWAFPIGETCAGEGFFPEAVGRFGNPSGIWSRRQSMSGYGHGDYWPNPLTAPQLANILGAPVAVPMAENVIPERQATTNNPLPTTAPAERSLQSRSLPGAP